MVMYQTKHHTGTRIAGNEIANVHVSTNVSLRTTPRTHHVHHCVSLCGAMQDPLEAAAIKSFNHRITHDDDRCCLSPRDCQQCFAGVTVFCDIMLRKGDATIGKKLFHVVARASPGG